MASVRHGVLGFAALAFCAGALSACGSSSASSAATGSVRSACLEVGAVLSDGPTPKADPMGYAEAQILPLRKIHTDDEALHAAIDDLASAYQKFYAANGTKAAGQAVSHATKAVDAICPGVVAS